MTDPATSRVGITYDIPPAPPDPQSTDWVDFGPLRIGVEYRKVDPEALQKIYGDTEHLAELEAASPEGGFTDEGVSVHVVGIEHDHEYVRFDMFVDEPHYHYVDREAATNTIVLYDSVAHGPMVPWTLGQLRDRLADMIRHAGGSALADSIDTALGAAVAEGVESKLREIGELA